MSQYRFIGSGLVAAALLACTGAAWAQPAPYPAEAVLRFEVWNGNQWASSVNANAGSRVEWRAVVSYTGTRTDVQALADLLFQPIIPNADNEGPVRDEVGAWRNGGVTGNPIAGSMLTEAEGNDPSALASYGRVGFGSVGTSADNLHLNLLSTFRHSSGSDNAPPGDWIRLAGSYVNQWPQDGSGAWTHADGNRILRGISISQASRFSFGFPNNVNPYYREGTQDIVVFRQALILGDAGNDRAIEITADESSLRRATMSPFYGDPTDNRRYLTWYTADNQTFSQAYRTSLAAIVPAVAFVTVPAPAPIVLLCSGMLLVSRRRR